MLLFCRRMCHQLLLASNCFLSTRCYCYLLVNCTNHFFLKSVLCSCTIISHGQRLHFSATAQREIGFALSSSSNSEPNLLQLVSLKRDRKGDRLLFVCLLFHQQSSIIVITLNIFGTGTLGSILVELHKMIGILHAPDSYLFPNRPC